MDPPFSAEQFFTVFSDYNTAVWPAQLFLVAIALGALMLTRLRENRSQRSVAVLLGALWAWSGVAYHIAHFAAVNPAARVFGGLFIVQGGLFVWVGAVHRRLAFARARG